MSISQEKINFKIARDFGETFNVSIKFLRQNFMSFFICLLFLAGPFVLLYSCVYAHYESVLLDKNALLKAGRLYNVNTFTGEYFLSFFLQMIAYLSMVNTTYAYMVVYNEKGKGNFSVGDVAKKMNSNIGKIIGGFLLFFILTVIFLVATFFIVGMIGESSDILGGILIFLLIILFLLVGPNLLWQLNTVFLIINYDDEIPISAYGRTREVMKDNYWWTWLIVVCSMLMVSLLSLLFAVPSILYTLINTYSTATIPEETSVLYVIVYITCAFLTTMVFSVFYIINSFHYFSLAEKKDGKGLLEKINEIGRIQTTLSGQQF